MYTTIGLLSVVKVILQQSKPSIRNYALDNDFSTSSSSIPVIFKTLHPDGLISSFSRLLSVVIVLEQLISFKTTEMLPPLICL